MLSCIKSSNPQLCNNILKKKVKMMKQLYSLVATKAEARRGKTRKREERVTRMRTTLKEWLQSFEESGIAANQLNLVNQSE